MENIVLFLKDILFNKSFNCHFQSAISEVAICARNLQHIHSTTRLSNTIKNVSLGFTKFFNNFHLLFQVIHSVHGRCSWSQMTTQYNELNLLSTYFCVHVATTSTGTLMEARTSFSIADLASIQEMMLLYSCVTLVNAGERVLVEAMMRV